MKTWLRVAVTLLLCAGLLIYVVDVRALLETLSRFDLWWALAAAAALLLDRALMSYKWGLLLAIRGYKLRMRHKLMVYCSAMMWGMALPSTVGADGIRVMLVRRFGVRVDDSLATILVERGVGFISALTTAVIGLVFLTYALPHHPTYRIALWFGIAGILGGVAILVFSFDERLLNAIVKRLPRRLADSKVVQLIHKLHDAYRSLAVDRGKLAAFAVLTFLEQLLTIACYGLAALALGVHFDPLFLLAATPVAILVSRLPISIDGLGVYEGIFMAIMAIGGVRPADSLAISLAVRALQVVVWLPWWLALMGQTGFVRPTQEPVSGRSR